MTSILLENVFLDYPVFTNGSQQSLLANVANRASFGKVGKTATQSLNVRALSDINLTLEKGDRLGIIGRNGAGKTTLLKVLSKIIWPTKGNINIEGTVRNVISLGAGLDIELTGFDNIKFICRLFGLNSVTTKEIIKDIEEFSELGEFLNIPVSTYSSGMLLRLSFGLMTALPTEILIIDEVLSAGDAHFIAKANARMASLLEKAQIAVYATHSHDILNNFCNKAILLERGTIVKSGSPAEVWDYYIQQEQN